MNCLLERGSQRDNHLVLLAGFYPSYFNSTGFFPAIYIFQMAAPGNPTEGNLRPKMLYLFIFIHIYIYTYIKMLHFGAAFSVWSMVLLLLRKAAALPLKASEAHFLIYELQVRRHQLLGCCLIAEQQGRSLRTAAKKKKKKLGPLALFKKLLWLSC